MIMQFLRRAFRSVRYRSSALLVQPYLQAMGLRFHGRCIFVGFPIVDLAHGSTIVIGESTVLISKSFATDLGVSHPVILRTLCEGARIQVGSRVGMSGTTICSAKSVKVGDDCLFGANVTIADTDFHPLEPNLRRQSSFAFQQAQAVEIGCNVFIGAGAIVLKGVSIGDNSVIGAGAVVTKNIPKGVIAAGNPCRIVRSL